MGAHRCVSRRQAPQPPAISYHDRRVLHGWQTYRQDPPGITGCLPPKLAMKLQVQASQALSCMCQIIGLQPQQTHVCCILCMLSRPTDLSRADWQTYAPSTVTPWP